jgi:hypothetical protein
VINESKPISCKKIFIFLVCYNVYSRTEPDNLLPFLKHIFNGRTTYVVLIAFYEIFSFIFGHTVELSTSWSCLAKAIISFVKPADRIITSVNYRKIWLSTGVYSRRVQLYPNTVMPTLLGSQYLFHQKHFSTWSWTLFGDLKRIPYLGSRSDTK